MKSEVELSTYGVRLVIKSVIMAANWVFVIASRAISQVVESDREEVLKDNIVLRLKVAELEDLVTILRSQLRARSERRRLTVKEKLLILWHMKAFNIPKRRAKEYYGVACSTIYRWLGSVVPADTCGKEPANITPKDLVAFVWKIAQSSPAFGKLKIAHQLALLGIFVSASTVRNILNRPEPRSTQAHPKARGAKAKSRHSKPIAAPHPDHTWSGDLTVVNLWGFLPRYVFVVIDHFSRKIVAAVPLKRPTTRCVISVLEKSFKSSREPVNLVTDKGSVFTSTEFQKFLAAHQVQHTLGRLGQADSISVTERLILTLKSEWLRRVILIRGFDHLTRLCSQFTTWQNELRPHQRLSGTTPAEKYRCITRIKPSRTSKTVPANIECVYFPEARISGWRLKRAA